MKLEKWALVAEIVSGLAVVITLVILVLGVRENTATLRVTSAALARESLASLNDQAIAMSDEQLELIARSLEPVAKSEDFTVGELFWLRSLQRAFLQRTEAQYFRYQNGMLDEQVWRTVRFRAWSNINFSTTNRELWQADRTSVYTPDFVEAVESYQPPEGTSD